jgi:NADH-quinone oxidoreductase subunit E
MLLVKTEKKFEAPAGFLEKAKEIMERYPEGKHKSAIIPILHMAQQENENWLSVSAMDYVAVIMNIKPVEVYEVATFYSMFNMKPVGKYLLEVCHTGPCMLRGSDKVIEYLKSKLNIEMNGTSTDGLFTLKGVECLGACGYAPMMQVGKYYYEHLDTEDKIDNLLYELKQKGELEKWEL